MPNHVYMNEKTIYLLHFYITLPRCHVFSKKIKVRKKIKKIIKKLRFAACCETEPKQKTFFFCRVETLDSY
jgi:hypothetical protein